MNQPTENIEELATGKQNKVESEDDSVLDELSTDAPSDELNSESADSSESFSTTESSAQLLQQLVVEQRRSAELQERMLRQQAEMQNFRKRAERDVENAHKFALERYISDLLPVLDGLERGLETIPEADEAQRAAREGILITHKMFMDVLTKAGVEIVNPQGEIFNPQQHEAMSMLNIADATPNTVVQVLQRGYSLNGRLIRPAMVIVAKP